MNKRGAEHESTYSSISSSSHSASTVALGAVPECSCCNARMLCQQKTSLLAVSKLREFDFLFHTCANVLKLRSEEREEVATLKMRSATFCKEGHGAPCSCHHTLEDVPTTWVAPWGRNSWWCAFLNRPNSARAALYSAALVV